VTCREAGAVLTDHFDGRLDAAAQVRLHDHLEGCAACRARTETWALLTPAMRAAAPPALDEMRVRRLEVAVERGRLAPSMAASRARRRFAWVGPAVLAAAAVVLLVARASHGPRALVVEVRSARGASLAATSGAAATDVRPGARLGARQTLALAADGEAELSLGPGTTIGLHGPARLTFRGSATDVELALGEGLLDAIVAHRRAHETFVVAANGARVIVRGTRFSVFAGAARAWVRVDEGRVGVVEPGGAERAVSPGETLALSTPAPSPAPGIAAAAPTAPPEAAAVPRGCPTARACVATAQKARLAMRAGAYGRALAILSAEAGARGADACRGVNASCQRELGYLEAEALRLDGRLESAVDAYKRLDQPGAPSATRQNALYAAAQLEQRLGRAAAARTDYERALAAAPAGALHAEALLGAMESASEAHDPAAARVLARRYLGRFPDGPGAPRARLLVGGPSSGAHGPRE
jgi:hypothetical protein